MKVDARNNTNRRTDRKKGSVTRRYETGRIGQNGENLPLGQCNFVVKKNNFYKHLRPEKSDFCVCRIKYKNRVYSVRHAHDDRITAVIQSTVTIALTFL